MDQIRNFMQKIDALSIRERGAILAGVILAMFLVWDTFLMQPLAVKKQTIISDLQISRAEQTALNIKYQEVIQQLQAAPGARNRERLESLKRQLDAVEADLRESTDFLVSPENMAGVLRTILSKSSDLQLVEIKGLGATPLLTPPEQADTQTETVESLPVQASQAMGELGNAYKHGLKIIFEGDYASTLDFMREIESLEWGFFWENLDYEVTEYPTGRTALTLYTLSLDENWIGV